MHKLFEFVTVYLFQLRVGTAQNLPYESSLPSLLASVYILLNSCSDPNLMFFKVDTTAYLFICHNIYRLHLQLMNWSPKGAGGVNEHRGGVENTVWPESMKGENMDSCLLFHRASLSSSHSVTCNHTTSTTLPSAEGV